MEKKVRTIDELLETFKEDLKPIEDLNQIDYLERLVTGHAKYLTYAQVQDIISANDEGKNRIQGIKRLKEHTKLDLRTSKNIMDNFNEHFNLIKPAN